MRQRDWYWPEVTTTHTNTLRRQSVSSLLAFWCFRVPLNTVLQTSLWKVLWPQPLCVSVWFMISIWSAITLLSPGKQNQLMNLWRTEIKKIKKPTTTLTDWMHHKFTKSSFHRSLLKTVHEADESRKRYSELFRPVAHIPPTSCGKPVHTGSLSLATSPK